MLVCEWVFCVVLLRFQLLCGAAGVPGAACCVRPGCAVGSGPPASRPRREPFARVGCCLWHRWCSGRRMARPPARLGNLTSFGAAPRSPPVPSGPSGTLHTGGACCCVLPGQAPPPPTGTAAWPLLGPRRSPPDLRPSPSLPSFLNPHVISHAIPPRLFQTLNSDRWNCNVF